MMSLLFEATFKLCFTNHLLIYFKISFKMLIKHLMLVDNF